MLLLNAESTSGTKGSGLPMRKKRKITSGPGGKFKASSLPLARRESNERGDSVKLLTVLIRVFEPENGKIVTQHLDTIYWYN
jgi:hypothetical protein